MLSRLNEYRGFHCSDYSPMEVKNAVVPNNICCVSLIVPSKDVYIRPCSLLQIKVFYKYEGTGLFLYHRKDVYTDYFSFSMFGCMSRYEN